MIRLLVEITAVAAALAYWWYAQLPPEDKVAVGQVFKLGQAGPKPAKEPPPLKPKTAVQPPPTRSPVAPPKPLPWDEKLAKMNVGREIFDRYADGKLVVKPMTPEALREACSRLPDGCFVLRYNQKCDYLCAQKVANKMRDQLGVLVVVGGYWRSEPTQEAGCIGFRFDHRGTIEMAELVRMTLGANYFLGRGCTGDESPINIRAHAM